MGLFIHGAFWGQNFDQFDYRGSCNNYIQVETDHGFAIGIYRQSADYAKGYVFVFQDIEKFLKEIGPAVGLLYSQSPS
jgi:hypothetical protein